jgi:peptidoglycan/xylan/chitin deacetylase (PgdA/CDA1 family)
MASVNRKTIYLTLDLEQDYGTALKHTRYNALRYSDEMIHLLDQNKIPLTVFVQTEILEKDILPTPIKKYPLIEFEPHSHSHRVRMETSMKDEITESTEDYVNYFHQKPIGYRFPDGNVVDEDYQVLSDLGYKFDSSIFPYWRPGRFDNSTYGSEPFLLNGIIEIPFHVEKFVLKFPISLSYYKRLGPFFRNKIHKNLPDRLIFDFHMHDLGKIPESYKELGLIYKSFYANTSKSGLFYLKKFIDFCVENGFQFDLMKNYYAQLSHKLFEE